MRVAHITPAFHPNTGGIETLLSLLLPELRKSGGVDASVMVGAPNIWMEAFTHIGVEEHDELDIRVARFGRFSDTAIDSVETHLRVAAAVRELMERWVPAILHIHGPSRLAYPAYRTARSLGIPQVLHIHGSVKGNFSPAFIRMCQEVETVIVPSQYVADSLYRDAGRKTAVHVCFNAVKTPVSPANIRPGLYLASPRLITAGRLEANKGHDIAIHSVRRLVDSRLPVTLTIFGEGPERQSLEDLAVSLKIRDHVMFNDPISHDEFLAGLETYDFVLVPSRGFEGFGLVAAEAASRAVICIASDTGGLREVVVHGVTGLLVPENDPDAIVNGVLGLVSDMPKFNMMRLAARNHAESAMSLQALASSILNVYATLAKGA